MRNQFTKDELKRIGKHDTYQHDLKLEMDRLEDKIKGDMEVKEKNLRNKVTYRPITSSISFFILDTI